LEEKMKIHHLRKLDEHGTVHGTILTIYTSVFAIYFFSLWVKENGRGCASTFEDAETQPIEDYSEQSNAAAMTILVLSCVALVTALMDISLGHMWGEDRGKESSPRMDADSSAANPQGSADAALLNRVHRKNSLNFV